VGTGQYL